MLFLQGELSRWSSTLWTREAHYPHGLPHLCLFSIAPHRLLSSSNKTKAPTQMNRQVDAVLQTLVTASKAYPSVLDLVQTKCPPKAKAKQSPPPQCWELKSGSLNTLSRCLIPGTHPQVQPPSLFHKRGHCSFTSV